MDNEKSAISNNDKNKNLNLQYKKENDIINEIKNILKKGSSLRPNKLDLKLIKEYFVEQKAKKFLFLDLTKKSKLYDYLIIVEAHSSKHLFTLADRLRRLV